MISFILSTTLYLFITALTFTALLALWFIAKPYYFFQHYKKQGGEGYFTFMGGFFHDRVHEAHEQGDFLKYFKRIIQRHPATKFFVSNVGSQAMLYLSDPELIKEFVNQPQRYKKAKFISGVEGLFEGQGILFSEGEAWKKQRKLLTSTLYNELLKEQVPMISRVTEEIYDSILKKSRGAQELNGVDISEINKKIAGDIIGQIFFGKRYSKAHFEGEDLTTGMRNLLNDGFKEMYTLWNAVLGAWFIRAGVLPKHKMLMNRIVDLRFILAQMIRESKKVTAYKDNSENTLLDSLLEQQRQMPDYAMTEDELVDNFISLFLAATDTVGNLVTMATYYLSKNEDSYREALNEAEKNLANEKILDFSKIQKLDFMAAIIKETLRKANPEGILVFREATEDHSLNNLNIKKGTLVTFSPVVNGYNKQYFSEADNFEPRRWLPGSDKNQGLKGHPFAYIPFSAGPRTCIGQHLALIEGKAILSSFIRKFGFEISKGYRLRMTNRGTYEPIDNLKMKLSIK